MQFRGTCSLLEYFYDLLLYTSPELVFKRQIMYVLLTDRGSRRKQNGDQRGATTCSK